MCGVLVYLICYIFGTYTEGVNSLKDSLKDIKTWKRNKKSVYLVSHLFSRSTEIIIIITTDMKESPSKRIQ